MQWSPEQDRALQEIDRWVKAGSNSPQVFRLFGYAGTGKTTLAKEIANNAGGNVGFATFTGKAAHVLKQKGCPTAQTIHSLIYNPKDKSQKNLKDLEVKLADLLRIGRTPKPTEKELQEVKDALELERKNLSRPSFSLNLESNLKYMSLLVVDECSMVDDRLAEDLLSFGTKILALGDPGQLPPVKGTGCFINRDPDFMLKEIHRQARDNPIIAMATKIRNGERLELGSYGESDVIMRSKITPDRSLAADQLIVGKNKTRSGTNKRMRELLGFHHVTPMLNDKIICLKNNHELGLLNGAMFYVKDVGSIAEEKITFTISPEDGMGSSELLVTSHLHYFLGKDEALDWWVRKEAEEFDYGYAVTCHKAQGSQWSDVVVFDESSVFRQDSEKWLYTAVTRAAEKVTVVLGC